MLFTSLEYLLFLPAVVALFWILPHRFRHHMLLVASYIFYMSWIPAFILLIVPMTLFNWLLGRYMFDHMEQKKGLLTFGIVANLLTLATFKYANFFASSASSVFSGFSHHNPHWAFNIILPLGISFFTFEFIHYLFEIYRGNKPISSFTLFALFAAFFPTQIAGPVKRYPDFLAQMKEQRPLKLSYFDEGVPLIITGLAKKLLLANNLSILVQMGFAQSGSYGALELWLFAWAFTFQIYFDFSAYTDIGRGSAMLFGYHIPINFDLPLIADNMTDFWKRWHISLSTWLRDYLFIPMGGSRKGHWRTNWNVFVTMTLGGLWHGAAWNFVVWGIYHGLCLVVHKEFSTFTQKIGILKKLTSTVAWNLLSKLLTFNAVAVGCVFFGVQNIRVAFTIVRKMVTLHPIFTGAEAHQPLLLRPDLPIAVPAILCLLAALLILNLPLSKLIQSGRLKNKWSGLTAGYCAALIALMVMFLSDTSSPFIYFQF